MANETSAASFDNVLRNAIQNAIYLRLLSEVDPAIDRMIAEHKERILKAHENAVSEVVIELMAMTSFERVGTDLRIVIHNKFVKDKVK